MCGLEECPEWPHCAACLRELVAQRQDLPRLGPGSCSGLCRRKACSAWHLQWLRCRQKGTANGSSYLLKRHQRVTCSQQNADDQADSRWCGRRSLGVSCGWSVQCYSDRLHLEPGNLVTSCTRDAFVQSWLAPNILVSASGPTTCMALWRPEYCLGILRQLQADVQEKGYHDQSLHTNSRPELHGIRVLLLSLT